MPDTQNQGAIPHDEISDVLDTWREDATTVMSEMYVAKLREAMVDQDDDVDSRPTILMSEGEVMRLRLACMGARD